MSKVNNTLNKQKRLLINKDLWEYIDLDQINPVTLNPEVMESFVFVTASSSNHFEESQDAVASVQHHFPKYKIIYYDLGLTRGQIKEVRSTFFEFLSKACYFLS